MHILPLTAQEVERRLIKVSDLAIHEAIEDGENIQVILDHFIEDGSEIKFKAPVDCSAITRLVVKYTDAGTKAETSKTFAFADANGKHVGKIDNLFAKGAVVKVILDLDPKLDTTLEGVDGAAFVQIASAIASATAVQIIEWGEND